MSAVALVQTPRHGLLAVEFSTLYLAREWLDHHPEIEAGGGVGTARLVDGPYAIEMATQPHTDEERS